MRDLGRPIRKWFLVVDPWQGILTLFGSLKQRLAQIKSHEEVKEQDSLAMAFDNYLETGFQLATFQGPLCAEPVEGMAYFVEAVTLDREGIEQEQGIHHLGVPPILR